ncbi:hypothetical protein SARC_14292, partial [Sphaeroforma arctica JP610]
MGNTIHTLRQYFIADQIVDIAPPQTVPEASTCSVGEEFDRWDECAVESSAVVDFHFNVFVRQMTIYAIGMFVLYVVALAIVKYFLLKGGRSRNRDHK